MSLRAPTTYLISFFATLSLILVGLFAPARTLGGRTIEEAIDFRMLPEENVILTFGLTRRERGEIAVRSAEQYEPPRFGAFGNHVIQFMRGGMLFSGREDQFFNYHYANLALPELYALIRRLEQLGKLPTELLLVQITTPNNDNGMYIVGFGGEMPLKYLWLLIKDEVESSRGESTTKWLHRVMTIAIDGGRTVLASVYHELDYSTFLTRLQPENNWTLAERVIDRRLCEDVRGDITPYGAGWTRYVPGVVRDAISTTKLASNPRLKCTIRYLDGALNRDGGAILVGGERIPVLNANPIDPSFDPGRYRILKKGDEEEVAHYMRKIDSVARRNGRTAVFLIPPVYETPRASAVDRVFSEALTLVPDLQIIDHRSLGHRKDFFHDYDHPNDNYFRFVAAELRERGLLQLD